MVESFDLVRRLDRRLASRLATLLARVLVTAGCFAGRASPVRADGAFPNSQSVLLARDRPNQLILGTTFGLVFSEDDGATWRYSCENDETEMGRQYLVGAPPDDRIFALSDPGIPVSADGACTWAVAGGDITQKVPFDVFPDPTQVQRAYALAGPLANDLDPAPAAAYRSTDGGLTFAGPIFTAPDAAVLTGIESAAADPMTVYLTYYEALATGPHPWLARSKDGGTTWTTVDIEAAVGSVIPYLAAVDRADPRKIYLRITSGIGVAAVFEGLAITADAGATFTIPLQVPNGSLAGLAVMPNGTLFVIGVTARPNTTDSPPPAGFRSEDGGRTFTTEPLSFHAAGLAERNGTLYVATNDFLDGFALTSSTDSGRTWRPRLRFREIRGVKECVRASCQRDCDNLAGVKLFPPETCNPPSAAAKGCGCGLAVSPVGAENGRVAAALTMVLFAVLGGVVARRQRSSR